MAQVETENRATSNEDSRKVVLRRVEKEKAEFVLLWFTDLEGHLKSFAITPHELEAALDDGMGFDGSSITGFNAIEESRHGRDPRSRDVPDDAVEGRRDPRRADDLRRRHPGRQALRRRPALRPAPGARTDGVDGLRHLQHRPRARVLPLQGRQRHGDARRGRLLRDDHDGRGGRAAQRDDPRAHVGRDPGRVPPPRGRARRSTRSTCATRPRSRWPTTRSHTG